MIDGHLTRAEREHIDGVWSELGGPTRDYVSVAPRRTPAKGAARFHAASANRKLAPVDLIQFPGQPRPRPIAQGPFASSTYVSIQSTCPDSCAFKRSGCFADSGFTKIAGEKMDAAARHRTPLEVIREEARLMRKAFRGGPIPQDGARGGRDLRLHVGGDVGTEEGARELGRAAGGWRARGGGSVWSYTHWWREVPRSAWGKHVSALASVESTRDFAAAAAQGYAPAIVVDHFESKRAFVAGGWRIIPCPAETSGAKRVTCVDCRLCFDGDGLLRRRSAIAFAVHGTGTKAAVEKLVQIGRRT